MAKPFKINAKAIHKLEDGAVYSPREIAEITNVGYSTVHFAIKNGDVPHEHVSRTGKGAPVSYGIRGEHARAWLFGKIGKPEAMTNTPEHKIYEFMLSYQNQHGKPPIIKDIGAAVSMSPAYVKRALVILLDRGYVQELVNGALYEAIPDEHRHRPNPLLGETDGAHCRCGVALVWPQHITPEAVAALAERATVSDKRTWEEAVARAQDLVRDMLTSDGVHCGLCAKGQ